MAFCGKCGQQVNDGVKFCPACGAPMAAVAPYSGNTAPAGGGSATTVSTAPTGTATTPGPATPTGCRRYLLEPEQHGRQHGPVRSQRHRTAQRHVDPGLFRPAGSYSDIGGQRLAFLPDIIPTRVCCFASHVSYMV